MELEDNLDYVLEEIPSIEDEIECYAQAIWSVLLGMYDRYGNFDTTSTMLCSKCGKPEPSSVSMDGPKPSMASMDSPELSFGSMDSPEPSSGSMDGPEPSSEGMDSPEPSFASMDSPEPSSASMDSPCPEPSSGSTDGPEPSFASIDSPEPSSGSMDGPEPSSASMDSPCTEPSSESMDSPCTECCLPRNCCLTDSPKFSSWELAKEELDMIFEDNAKFHMVFKKSMDEKSFLNCSIDRLTSVEPEYPEGDQCPRFMRYDYMSFLKSYCPPVLLDMILNFWHGNKFILLERVFVKYMDCDRVHQNAKRLLSFCSPLEYYPRKSTDSKRCITFHYGPTNSGKTFEALKSFKGEGKSAIYCAPLRLLAMQIYQDVNKEGILCDLKTGEDVKHHSGSVKCCCTVELADLSKKWEVAVIDEIQMIGDEQRGGAWTRAFLGLNAEEIHLCGEGSVSELIQQLCKLTGDRLTMVKHHRRSQLVVEDEALLLRKGKIESGDCFVAFSVRKLKEIKKRILFHQPDMKCTLLYGSLPPEVKFEAAEKFMKDCENKKGVLIATDAIGMGLNLPIRRVIFTDTQKYDGDSVSYVKIPLVKQIAGRAGRGSENGYCTATDPSDLKYLRKCVESPIEPIKEAVLDLDPKILPILEHRWRKLGDFDFVDYLRSFENCLLLSGCVENAYKPLFRFRSFQKEFWNVARELTFDNFTPRMTLSDFFTLCNCPYGGTPFGNCWMRNMFLSFRECLFKHHKNAAFPYKMHEYNCENVYGYLRAYKYLYNQFPHQRYLMVDYDFLPELELQIKTLIQAKEKKEEEDSLRYHSDSDSD